MSSRWTISLLGTLAARSGDAVVRPLSAKASALLAWLALNARTPHTREELATLLWPDASPAAGRHSLRTALYDLRRLLEPPPATPGSVLSADRDSVQLVPGAFATDVDAFTAAASAAGAAQPADRIDAIRQAAALYGGELLPGSFEPWVLAERRRLAEIHAGLLARLLAELSDAGDVRGAIDVAHRLLGADPLNDDAHLRLMRLYAAEGRAGAALEQYRTYAALLDAELGVEPSDEAAALARSQREQFRSGGGRAGAAPGIAKSRLPTPLTQFVGREAELAGLGALLEDAGTRLVTLAGPGGIGKTRLAVEFAQRARDERDAPVTYVELADVIDESFVPDSIAAACGLPSLASDDPLDAYAAAIAESARPLLVIDNAERVGGMVAAAVQYLLANAPDLRVLVTSRRPLGIPGELEMRLGPLPVPSEWEKPSDLAGNASVAMYVDRVRARRADFKLTDANAAAVARLCTRLEGIPLALELAAVRERVLPASRLVGLLEKRFEVLVGAQRDVPERHRTLSAAIDWSFHALDPDTRRVFAELAVFRGGWSIDDAEAACGVAVDAMLERMCDVSLVEAFDRAGTRRFRMLETIREFALEQMPDVDRDALRRRHAERFVAVAEQSHDQLTGPEQAQWFERLDADVDNVRAALDWSMRSGDFNLVVRIVVALYRYWQARSRQREARRWLREALAMGADSLPRRLRRHGLRFAGELAISEAELADATGCFDQALALGEVDEDPQTAAYVMSGLGHIAARQGRFDDARALLLRGLAYASETADVELRASLENGLGVLAARTRDYEGALAHFENSLEAYRAGGDDTSVITVTYNLGYLATITGQLDRAEQLLDESLAVSRRLGHASGLASASTFRGLLELARRRYDAAVSMCREAVELCLEVGDAHRLVLAVEGLGCALGSLGQDELAARAIGHAESLRDSVETEALMEDAGVVAAAVAGLVARNGDAAVASWLAAGRDESTESLLAQ